MNRSELENEVRTTLARLTEQDTSEIPTDADLGDALGLDSLGRLELLAEVEDRLDMLFDDVDINLAKSIDGIIEITEHSIAKLEAEAG